MLGVSERSVRTARAVINEAAPELARAVESGRVSVSAAARLVDSLNVHRRHLTASQRAAAIVARHEWRPRGKSQPGGDSTPTTAEMAKEANVSHTTIEQAKAAHAAGIGEDVRTGKLSAKDAAEKAKAQKSETEKPGAFGT